MRLARLHAIVVQCHEPCAFTPCSSPSPAAASRIRASPRSTVRSRSSCRIRRPGTIVPTVDSIAAWGTVGTGRATLEVNGSAVRVEPNGTFARFIPAPAGAQPGTALHGAPRKRDRQPHDTAGARRTGRRDFGGGCPTWRDRCVRGRAGSRCVASRAIPPTAPRSGARSTRAHVPGGEVVHRHCAGDPDARRRAHRPVVAAAPRAARARVDSRSSTRIR